MTERPLEATGEDLVSPKQAQGVMLTHANEPPAADDFLLFDAMVIGKDRFVQILTKGHGTTQPA